MNILAVYIRKYLQKNKISTILSTLSLMCASIFFYIVVCLSVNTIIGLQDFTINSFGNYHAVFENVNDDFIRSLQLHGQIDKVNIVEFKNQIYLDNFQSVEKESFYLLGIDNKTFDELGLRIYEGRFPKNNHEILISNSSLDDSLLNLDIGEHIELNQETYEIVGITTNIHFEENQNYYTILSLKENIGTKNAYLHFKNQKDISYFTNKIANDFIGEYESFHVNNYYSYSLTQDANRFFLFFVLFIVCLLITFFIMNVSLIRNCFKNSYANREKHLAILKTVGVTQAQCKTMILYEGVILLLFSLPIGCLFGFVSYEILRTVLNQLLRSISVHTFIIGNEYKWILLLVTVLYVSGLSFICIHRSNSKIVKQNVSLTLQSSDEVQVMDHPYLELEKKQPILLRLLKKNIRQNKIVYRPLVIGVTCIATLFILVNGFMGYLREGIFFETSDHNYDVEVIIQNEYYPTQLMTKLKTRENASFVVISESMYLDCYDSSILNKEYQDVTYVNGPIQFEVMTFNDQIIENFITPDNYVELIDVDKPNAVVINKTYSSSHRHFVDILDANQIKELYFNNQVILENVDLFLSDSLITGTGYQKNPQMIVTHELFDEIFLKTENPYHEYHIYYQSNDTTSLIRELNQLNHDMVFDFDVVNTQATIRNGKLMTVLIRIISYGYILLLAIMAMLSVSCTASINFDYRKKELMLYRLLGLRMKELLVLVFMELTYYVSKVMIYSWACSQLLNYICYHFYFKALGLKYFIPMNSVYGSFILIIIFLLASMIHIYWRMKSLKYSIILKNEMSLM